VTPVNAPVECSGTASLAAPITLVISVTPSLSRPGCAAEPERR
jgi:hypothetical protein